MFRCSAFHYIGDIFHPCIAFTENYPYSVLLSFEIGCILNSDLLYCLGKNKKNRILKLTRLKIQNPAVLYIWKIPISITK